jgi:MFS family permease
MLRFLKYLYHEFGLSSVNDTGRDAYLIILARCCRMFAYGTNALILALFFAQLQFSDSRIGLFMTLTLVGDVVLGLLLTLVADKVGRRRTLVAGSLMMIASGTIFAVFENFWILLFAAVIGVISVTGGDFGPFRAIEESIISHLTIPKTRSDVLSWYVTMSALGSSFGTEMVGRIVQWLQEIDGWELVDAYHACFWVYSGMGLVNLILSISLSKNCEASSEQDQVGEEADVLLTEMDDHEEDAGVPSSQQHQRQQETQPSSTHPRNSENSDSKFTSRFSKISAYTRTTMYKLWFLLSLDSLADGMTPFSLTTYYIDTKFSLKPSTLGDISSVSYFLAACSTIFAAPLSRHLGLVNTMVFTHIPSSTAVLLFPFPNSVILTVALLLIRMGLNNMDQAPRAALIAAVVKPQERTAVMGITSMLRTLASTAGPWVTGVLAGEGKFWIAFVVAGVARLAYDLGLWVLFVNVKIEGEEGKKKVVDNEAELGDESVELAMVERSRRNGNNDTRRSLHKSEREQEEAGRLLGDEEASS